MSPVDSENPLTIDGLHFHVSATENGIRTRADTIFGDTKLKAGGPAGGMQLHDRGYLSIPSPSYNHDRNIHAHHPGGFNMSRWRQHGLTHGLLDNGARRGQG